MGRIVSVAIVLGLLAGATAWGQQVATRPTTAPTTQQTAIGPFATERYRLVNQSDEIVSVLENGMTVIARRVPSPVVSVRGYAQTGGAYEGKWLGGGLSHLLEHLVAGGSNQRHTEAESRSILQHIGNNSNAYTTQEDTAYFINTTPQFLDEGVDLVTSWMLGALITPEEYKREYQVVQRELEMGKGEPSRQFWYLSAMNRYRVNPARVPVIGYQSVIQGLSRDDVYEYYKQAYVPNNMVFSVAGDLDPAVMLRAVQRHVGDARPGRVFSHEIPQEPPVTAPRTLVATAPKLGEAKLDLGFPSVKLDDPDLYALDLLAEVLGGGESSLLVEEIRDKRELATMIAVSDYTPAYAQGTFAVYMQLPPAKVQAATKAVLDLIEQVKREGVSADRLDRAKTQVRAGRVKGMQTSEQIAASLAGDYMTTGDPHFGDRYVERIAKVTPAEVQAVARKYLDTGRLITTAMLPAEYVGAQGLPKAEDLIRAAAPTTRQAPQEASQVTRLELGNGTILLHKRLSTTPLVVMNMYALGGLTVEDASTNGLGNLTMETALRGTTTRSAQQIAEFFDSIGGDINTACGNNSWYWTATCLKEDFPKAMEAYADVVSNPSFPDTETAQMKQRVLAQIESQDANWNAQAMRFFRQQYFGPSKSPYQFQVIGKKENVEAFTPAQLKQWYTQNVLSAPRVLAIYGDVDLDQARTLAERYLGQGTKVTRRSGTGTPPVSAEQEPGRGAHATTMPAVQVTRVEVQKTEQPVAGIFVGFRSDSVVGDEANFPLAVAKTMTGGYGYPTGYLHEVLRGQGLVYVVQDQNWPGRNGAFPGTFFAFAGCEPSKANQVVDLMLQNIARLQGTPADIQPDWFARSKQLIVTSDALETETAAEQASQAALDELYGMGYNYHDRFADRIAAVTFPQVQSIARSRLRDCIVTVCTPAPELLQVKPGVREYSSFPPVDLTPRGVQHEQAGGAGK